MFPPMEDFYGNYGGEDYYYDDYYGEEGYVNSNRKGKKEKKKTNLIESYQNELQKT
jgi:hypothetical protein